MSSAESATMTPEIARQEVATNIVVIDQDAQMLSSIRSMLEGRGFSVYGYRTGIDAITGLDGKTMDCILLDMYLVDESGADVSELMRSLPSYKDIPIIFLSASDSQEDILRALRSGANDYLRKPFHEEELIARIRAHTRVSQQKRQLEEQNKMLHRRNQESIILSTRAVMLQELMKQYTPRSTWEKADLAALKGMIEIADEDIEITLLFLDIKSFTAYCEKRAAGEVIGTLNEFFKPITAIIDAAGGDIDKFIGDSIFAIFHKSGSAVKAAWEIQKKIQAINANRQNRQAPELNVRIGLNRGHVVRGNVGGPNRKENTLIGDAVNAASRIEKACKPGKILLSESVKNDLDSSFQVGRRLLLKARGKEDYLPIYYLEGIRPAQPRG